MRKKWRCFHCDEVFEGQKFAAEHFGVSCDQVPACRLTSHEGHLVTYIRKLEADLEQCRREDSDVMRSIQTLEADHRAALIREEQRGYDKGVRDMKAQGQCPEPEKHAA